MKPDYHRETNSLYIKVAPQPGVDSEEIEEGIVLDYDAGGKVVGIDIDDTSQLGDIDSKLQELILAIAKKVPMPLT